jgi:GTP cyclohydrolase I
MSISDTITARIKTANGRFLCNDNISDFIKDENELHLLQEEVAEKMQAVLESLVIDTDNDHNTHDTARRVAKMFIKEIFSGRYVASPKITSFPNAQSYDQLYIVGPIDVRSTCAHHFQNIVGSAWVGVFPGKNVIGLSKFNRIVDHIASRPQIQEEMTVQIANEIERITDAEGIAVVVKAEHMCMTHRGVKAHESDMVTSVMRGALRDQPKLRDEFFSLLQGMKGYRS